MKLKIMQEVLISFLFGFFGIASFILLIKVLHTGFGRENRYFPVLLMRLGICFYQKIKVFLKKGADMHDSQK
ncbi:hypothetical protein [Streptococcus marmotae]|uniref:hypothetical protein n=1 Tax=Streptococcus marmotae TaxID=1825069 RepID=UPI000832BAD3|nr:hypothetical protein [Streptococcus marmotae]